MTEKKKKLIKFVILSVVILALVGFLTYFVGEKILAVVSDLDKAREWANGYGVWSYLLFGLMIIVQVILAFIPGEPFEIAAGVIFGTFGGTVLCIVSSFIGSMIVFFIVRKFGMKVVKLFFKSDKLDELHFLRTSRNREILYLIIYMTPGTPKDLLSYFAGLTDIKLPVWMLICSFGRIPSVITSTIGGDFIAGNNYISAAVVFGVTLLISIAGIIIYNGIKSKNSRKEGKENAEDK